MVIFLSTCNRASVDCAFIALCFFHLITVSLPLLSTANKLCMFHPYFPIYLMFILLLLTIVLPLLSINHCSGQCLPKMVATPCIWFRKHNWHQFLSAMPGEELDILGLSSLSFLVLLIVLSMSDTTSTNKSFSRVYTHIMWEGNTRAFFQWKHATDICVLHATIRERERIAWSIYPDFDFLSLW